MFSNKKLYSRVVQSSYPFSNSSLSCGNLAGRSHSTSEKDMIISLCCVLGETEVQTEMRCQSSLASLWKAASRSLPIQCSFHRSCNASPKHCFVSKNAEYPGEVSLSELPELALDGLDWACINLINLGKA